MGKIMYSFPRSSQIIPLTLGETRDIETLLNIPHGTSRFTSLCPELVMEPTAKQVDWEREMSGSQRETEAPLLE